MRSVERNYRCRHGEIDLIMRDGETLVFVEVRLRRNANYGGPLLSVDHSKRKRLAASAQRYLQARGRDCLARFDVVGIDEDDRVTWVRNAFEA